MRASGTDPVVCTVNCSDHYKLLKKGRVIARAQSIQEYLLEPEDELRIEGIDVCDISQTPSRVDADEPQVPDHLKETFEASGEHLTSKGKSDLAAFLNKHADVFAMDEFDLGTFTDIEHSINTENATPVTQRMRRTPDCFVEEEEAHLKKMLDAGVKQESTSEWASSPVLIRKRDGNVR